MRLDVRGRTSVIVRGLMVLGAVALLIPASTASASVGQVTEVKAAAFVGQYPYEPTTVYDNVNSPSYCGLLYHQYWPSRGCGGFAMHLNLNLGFDYSYTEDPDTGAFDGYGGYAHAEGRVRRTYGCVDEATDKVRRTVTIAEKRPIDSVYYSGELGSDWGNPDPTQGEFKPDFFLNFKPIGGAEGLVAARQELYCSIDETPKHLTTTVSNVRVVLDITHTVSDGKGNTVQTDLPPMKFKVDGRWTEDTAVCENEGDCWGQPPLGP